MQHGFQVLYCIFKLQINGIAFYYVSGEELNIHKIEYVRVRLCLTFEAKISVFKRG